MGACCSAPDGAVLLQPSIPSKRGASVHSGKSGHGAKAVSVRKMPDFGIADLYEPLMLLGEGGSGATYLCEDKATGKK